jgi:hypothetical protein
MTYVLITWTFFRYVMLRHIMLHHVHQLPCGIEGCPGGEDRDHRPLQKMMPCHPIPEPIRGTNAHYCAF